jgi:hypothetical protein
VTAHPTLLTVLAVAAALGLLVVLLRRGPGADFEIRYRPGGRVEVRGRIPRAKVGEIRAFFGRDLAAGDAGAVRGWFGPGRTLRLRFRGGLSPAQRQRARNFLMGQLL